jgi:CheY-like chemotaxis protein
MDERTSVILLAEDDADTAFLMSRELRRVTGCRIFLAREGREALKRLLQEPRPDILITDLKMPGMDGFDLIEASERRCDGFQVTGFINKNLPLPELQAQFRSLVESFARERKISRGLYTPRGYGRFDDNMSDASDQKSLRILVVENHPDTLIALQLYLEDLGHAVFTAGNIAEALAQFPVVRCDVLISDIGLPDGTGWELLDRAGPMPHTFAIAMSGFGMNADSDRSRAAGFRHHLLKPFKPDELDRILWEAAAMPEVSHAG